MRTLFNTIWKLLISRNVAIVLLTVITIMLAVGAWLPNPALMSAEHGERMMTEHPYFYWLGERYNSQKMASGYVFGFIGVLLIVSTTICSVDRLMKLSGTSARPDYFPQTGGLLRRVVAIDRAEDRGMVRQDLLHWLKRNRFRTVVDQAGDHVMIKGIRGTIGFWGSIMFHCILITALFGLVAYYLAGYRGRLVFTEGQSYALQEESFYLIEKKPIWGMRLPQVKMGLLSQYSLYDQKDPLYPLEHVARFRVTDIGSGMSADKDIKINEPLMIGDKKFLLIRGGFSPRIYIKDMTGRTVLDTYVALSDEGGTRDGFTMSDGTQVKVKLYPEKGEEKGKVYSKSMQLLNPHIALKIVEKGVYVFNKLVPLGKEMREGGYTVFFPNVKKWVELEMVDEPGIGFFFMISFAGLAGVLARILDPEERVYFSFSGSGEEYSLEINAFSRHYAGLLDERLNALAEKIHART